MGNEKLTFEDEEVLMHILGSKTESLEEKIAEAINILRNYLQSKMVNSENENGESMKKEDSNNNASVEMSSSDEQNESESEFDKLQKQVFELNEKIDLLHEMLSKILEMVGDKEKQFDDEDAFIANSYRNLFFPNFSSSKESNLNDDDQELIEKIKQRLDSEVEKQKEDDPLQFALYNFLKDGG